MTFVAYVMEGDYGVPGSPVLRDIEGITIEELKILGVSVKPEVLPTELIEKIHELAGELAW